jgi:all-trans-retinol 13,14-reductase
MSQNFDAIVIGSGLGGLTAAALYARAGHRVLVLERNEAFGGAATVYRHGALSIEASLHEIDGLDAGDAKAPLLQALGLDRDLAFVAVGDLHEVRSRLLGEPFVLPHGFDAARDAAVRRFPRQAHGLEEYFRRLQELREAVSMLAQHQDDRSWWLRNAARLPRRLWPLVRQRHATVSGVLAELFGADEAVKLALASNLGYYTDDPDTMPFIAYAIPQASYLAGGGHYIRGGSQVLTDRLLAIVREAGGEARSGRVADAILLDGDRPRGVRYSSPEDGEREALAPVIFGNAAPQVLAGMLPAAQREAFLAPYQARRPSISLWTMALGLGRPSREFGVARYSTSILPDWLDSLSRLKEAATVLGDDQASRLPPFGFVAYDQIDSGLNRDGPYLASLAGIDRVENWAGLSDDARRERKERWMDRIIGALDRHFPGLAAAVTQREMSTAETMQHYLNTPGGAIYGFAPQSRGFRPLARTAIDGLYLASAFTGGGGFTGAMLGGGWAARAALGRRHKPAA